MSSITKYRPDAAAWSKTRRSLARLDQLKDRCKPVDLYEIVCVQKRGRIACGPAAVAAITGLPYDDAHEAVEIIRRRPLIQRCYTFELVETLEALGKVVTRESVEPIESGYQPTLARWVKDHRSQRGVRLVILTGHAVALDHVLFFDALKRDGEFLCKAPHRRRRVLQCYRVTDR